MWGGGNLGEIYPEGPQPTPTEGCYLGFLLYKQEEQSPACVPQGVAMNIKCVWKTVEYYVCSSENKSTDTRVTAWLNPDAGSE